MYPTVTAVDSIIHPAPTFVVIVARGIPGLPISQADEYHHDRLSEATIEAFAGLLGR